MKKLPGVLGYERAYSKVSQPVAHHAQLLQQQFTEEVQKKNWCLSDLWKCRMSKVLLAC